MIYRFNCSSHHRRLNTRQFSEHLLTLQQGDINVNHPVTKTCHPVTWDFWPTGCLELSLACRPICTVSHFTTVSRTAYRSSPDFVIDWERQSSYFTTVISPVSIALGIWLGLCFQLFSQSCPRNVTQWKFLKWKKALRETQTLRAGSQ